MNRILVTGATGGLGRNVVHALLQKGVQVRASGRNAETGKALASAGAEFVALDLAMATPAQFDGLMRGVDAVWHCAALSSPWGATGDFVAANVTITQRLLQAAGQNGVMRFIHVSTPALYFDYTNRFDVKESFRPRSYVNAYARTKAQAEACVQDAVRCFPRMQCIILRPRAIFGPHDQVLVPRLCRVLEERGGRLPLPRGGRVTLDLTYVENVVHAMWLATASTRAPSGSVFNITNQQPIVLRDILRQLFVEGLQRQCDIVDLPYPLLAAVARGMQLLSHFTRREPALTPYSVGALGFDMTLDNTHAREVLGYVPPVPIADGVQRTAEWIKRHG